MAAGKRLPDDIPCPRSRDTQLHNHVPFLLDSSHSRFRPRRYASERVARSPIQRGVERKPGFKSASLAIRRGLTSGSPDSTYFKESRGKAQSQKGASQPWIGAPWIGARPASGFNYMRNSAVTPRNIALRRNLLDSSACESFLNTMAYRNNKSSRRAESLDFESSDGTVFAPHNPA